MRYLDPVTGQSNTVAANRPWKRAKMLLEPLMRTAKTGMEAREREIVIQGALSAVRVLKCLRLQTPTKSRSSGLRTEEK